MDVDDAPSKRSHHRGRNQLQPSREYDQASPGCLQRLLEPFAPVVCRRMYVRGDVVPRGPLQRSDPRSASDDASHVNVNALVRVEPIDDGLKIGTRPGRENRYSE